MIFEFVSKFKIALKGKETEIGELWLKIGERYLFMMFVRFGFFPSFK